MEHQKFSTIAHADHTFYDPMSEARAEQLIGLLEFVSDLPVLDVGCGRGELLIRICQRHNVKGVGVDINPTFIQIAQQTATARLQPGQATFVQQSVVEYNPAPASFSGALCLGASQAFGTYRDALAECRKLVSPGGFVLMGDGYWKKTPSHTYLDFLGATLDEMGYHGDNVQAGIDAGLIPLYTATSNDDEWDHYEGLYSRAAERYAYQHPEDLDSPAIHERITRWRAMYLKEGRATLGFGFYLFLNPT